MPAADWTRENTVTTITSPWVDIYCERWRDENGASLDYWRAERPNSVIILPIHNYQVLLPHPMFRPGVARRTLDFPGGRQPATLSPAEAALSILCRELAVDPIAVHSLVPLNAKGWVVNASFECQLLYAFSAEIALDHPPPASQVYASYPNDRDGMRKLLDDLDCLQCRAVVHEYMATL